MKKIIKIFIIIVILLFGMIFFVTEIDNRDNKKLINDISNNTQIDNIKYINRYGEYYIVLNDKYLYAINREYKIISEVDKILLYENENNYDIIYDDELFMYMEEVNNIYKYYDIYSYKFIHEVDIGG